MESKNFYSIVAIFLRHGICLLFSHTCMHSKSLTKHLHALADGLKKPKKLASENSQDLLHHNHTKTLSNST